MFVSKIIASRSWTNDFKVILLKKKIKDTKHINLDAPTAWQFGFQDPASISMEGIIDLHHEIMFFVMLIIIFVLFFFLEIWHSGVMTGPLNPKLGWFVQIKRFEQKFNNTVKSNLKLQHNIKLEIIWTVIPALILFFIAFPSFCLCYNLDHVYDPALTLKVIGNQWYWGYEYGLFYNSKYINTEMSALDGTVFNFKPIAEISKVDLWKVSGTITQFYDSLVLSYKSLLNKEGLRFNFWFNFDLTYPDSITSGLNYNSYMCEENENLIKGNLRLLSVDNMVCLPTNVELRLLVSSNDVLHSWAVPSLGIKIDACPGRINRVPLYIKREGLYLGQCSEICGVLHGFMPIVVKAVSSKTWWQDFYFWGVKSINFEDNI